MVFREKRNLFRGTLFQPLPPQKKTTNKTLSISLSPFWCAAGRLRDQLAGDALVLGTGNRPSSPLCVAGDADGCLVLLGY